MRGEAAALEGIVAEVVKLAQEGGDKSAQADAKCLESDVHQAQGDLLAAQFAMEESVAISRQLSLENPSSAASQRALAVALGRMGDLMQAQGQLAAAQAVFEESLAISGQLAEKDPSNVGWNRDLDIAHGRMSLPQLGRGADTREETRQIFRRHFYSGN